MQIQKQVCEGRKNLKHKTNNGSLFKVASWGELLVYEKLGILVYAITRIGILLQILLKKATTTSFKCFTAKHFKNNKKKHIKDFD